MAHVRAAARAAPIAALRLNRSAAVFAGMEANRRVFEAYLSRLWRVSHCLSPSPENIGVLLPFRHRTSDRQGASAKLPVPPGRATPPTTIAPPPRPARSRDFPNCNGDRRGTQTSP